MGWFGDILEDVGGAAVQGTVGIATGVFEVADTVTFGFLTGIGRTASQLPEALQWGGEQAGDVAGLNEAAYAQEDILKQQQKAQNEYTSQEVGRVQQRTNSAMTQAEGRNKAGSSGTF